ncbi:DUF309 domain-containing protein [Shimazuella alba]|uniref:DUF309 domain-containing protein n=1 Tax=Shimazuella alba TaxID=2690964 RepID=A0A6I4VZN0_9BACL|nr:DUF309 domain-containing protein [Shimazuella alba]MXQ53904.1 DUF309 domain-containing protein [Shimazuella alba]
MYANQYITFLYTFNQLEDYYTCHDLLEDLWLEEGREPFYQGLLQVAVSCYHARQGNRPGAIKLMQSAIPKLTIYPDHWEGIRVDKVISDAKQYLDELVKFPNDVPSSIFIEIWDKSLIRLVEQIELP